MTPPVVIESGILALVEGYGLPAAAGDALIRLHELLVDDPLAPTAVRDPVGVLNDHLADSLVALELPVVREARAIADLGSGAGLPGLPLAVALPAAQVTLVESAGRKCEFLRRAADECGLSNVEVVHARAEELGRSRREGWDLVTARALSSLSVLAEYAAPLLAPGGTLVAWRGQREPEGELEASRAVTELGLELGPILRVTPYREAQNRHLHLISKVRSTPDRFPRRPGMALKRPLGR